MDYPTDSPFTSALFALACKKLVDLLDQRISIGSVNGASVLNRLTSGCGASQAMHSDCKEELRGLGIKIKNVTDDGLLRKPVTVGTEKKKDISASESEDTRRSISKRPISRPT